MIYREVNSVHNIVINEDSGFAYAVGSSAGGDDVRRRSAHDRHPRAEEAEVRRLLRGRQHGPRQHRLLARRAVRELQGTGQALQAAARSASGRTKRRSASRTSPTRRTRRPSRAQRIRTSAYTHQGWFTEDHRYFYVNDELDEIGGAMSRRRARSIWDFADLENPKLVKEHIGGEAASDHNLYVKGDLMYQANYRAGLRILNIKDPANPKEVAFFDTAPYRPNTAGFNGAWSVLPVLQERLDRRQQHRAGAVHREDDRPVDDAPTSLSFARSAWPRPPLAAPRWVASLAARQPDLLYVCIQDDAKIAVVDMAIAGGVADDRPGEARLSRHRQAALRRRRAGWAALVRVADRRQPRRQVRSRRSHRRAVRDGDARHARAGRTRHARRHPIDERGQPAEADRDRRSRHDEGRRGGRALPASASDGGVEGGLRLHRAAWA